MFKPISLFYTDGYKTAHKKMLAPGTTRLYGTWIPRSVKYAPKGVKKIVSFGQQLVVRWLHDEFKEHFFSQPKEVATKFAKDMSMYLGMDYDGSHFEALHDVGYLPIRIKALPEGIETLPNIPHMTFINTIDGFAWLTLYLETIISSLAWKPSTSATIALQYRRNLVQWIMKTDPTNAWLIPFLAHDFSARGLSPWDMLSSGLGHATSFRGSDSIICIPAARYFYNEPENEVVINSVNASEHSVSTTKIFTVGEQQMIADWLVDFPKGILSIVSDTFDLWKLITEYLPANKEAIMRRGEYILNVNISDFKAGEELIPSLNENNESFYYRPSDGTSHSTKYIDYLVSGGYINYTPGKLVIRPDSGDPVDIICGLNTNPKTSDEIMLYEYCGEAYRHEYSESEHKGVIELLWDIFGGTINEQGYKVLDPHIGAIYGDSITLDRQIEIYERLAAKGFASTNIVLGVGSYTYQMNTRDTLGFAAKGAWFEVSQKAWSHPDEGELDIRTGYDIFKDPVTDRDASGNSTKKSLKGRCAVHLEDGEYVVKTQCTEQEEQEGILHTIYENGEFYNQTTLTEIRTRIESLI